MILTIMNLLELKHFVCVTKSIQESKKFALHILHSSPYSLYKTVLTLSFIIPKLLYFNENALSNDNC